MNNLPQKYDEPDAGKCLAFWQEVLLTVVKDALSISNTKRAEIDKRYARSYIGTFVSKDFRTVCDLSGINADEIHRRLLGMMDKPAHDRELILGRMVKTFNASRLQNPKEV